MKAKIIVWAIVAILVLIFVIGNTEPMELVFIKRFYVSKIVLIVICLAIGFISGLLVGGRKKSPEKKKVDTIEE